MQPGRRQFSHFCGAAALSARQNVKRSCRTTHQTPDCLTCCRDSANMLSVLSTSLLPVERLHTMPTATGCYSIADSSRCAGTIPQHRQSCPFHVALVPTTNTTTTIHVDVLQHIDAQPSRPTWPQAQNGSKLSPQAKQPLLRVQYTRDAAKPQDLIMAERSNKQSQSIWSRCTLMQVDLYTFM